MIEGRDNEQLEWTISVREIAEYEYRSGDLRNGERGPTGRMGAEGHRALQRIRPPGYDAEVVFAKTVVGKGVTLHLSGRADGVIMEEDPPLVEEIKTVSRAPLLIQDDNPVHWAQAEIYGALLADKKGLGHVEVRLTYLDLDSGQTRVFTKRRTAAELRAFFEQAVSVYLAYLERLATWRRTRSRMLLDARLPFDTPRPGQFDLADAVFKIAKPSGRLFVEAPTGSGKTAALLLGALRAVAAGSISQIVYLTAKTDGRRTVEETLRRFREQGTILKVVVIAAMKDRCLYPEAGCLSDACPLAKGHFDRVRDAVEAWFAARVSDEESLYRVSETHGVCPYHLAKECVPLADIVICDYNFFFDPQGALSSLLDGRNQTRLVLLDEAHNLPDRARDMFSAKFTARHLEEARKNAGHRGKSLQRVITVLLSTFADLVETFLPVQQMETVVSALPRSFLETLDAFLREMEAVLAAGDLAPKDNEAMRLCYFEALSFMRALGRGIRSDVLTLSRRAGSLALTLFARDPSPHLRRVLDSAKCASVFFSGTLSPIGFFSKLLGGDADDPKLVQPGIFPASNRLVAVAAHISTRYADRQRFVPSVVEAIRAAVLQKKGNYLVFFPSHAYLAMIAGALDLPKSRVEVIHQSPNPTAQERKKFIAKFNRKRPKKTLVGLAVLGGRFGESLDLPGETLIGAAIVSPALPAAGFEQELIRAHFEETEDKGFEYAYAYPGMNKVLQAAGRVHRTETDRGILLFIGKRFVEPVYRNLLPWPKDEINICRSTQAVEQTVAAFWKTVDFTPKRSK